jgi:hypothetical protein
MNGEGHGMKLNRYVTIAMVAIVAATASAADPIEIMFLGDDRAHNPRARADQLIPVLEKRGIALTYTEDLSELNASTLQAYDGVLIYANHDAIEPEQEQALLDYVHGGGGFIPIHCASYCFLNSDRYIELVGAQFKMHGVGTFRADVEDVDHPIVQDYSGFSSWDETYVHHRHNDENRTVLSYRAMGEQTEGNTREPWTWIRTHGSGRVFYTAWGHDHRTWGSPGFQNLIERGIRWAVGADVSAVPPYNERPEFDIPAMKPVAQDLPPFEYVDVGPKIPFYPASQAWGTQADPKNMMQLPLPAEEAINHYSVPEGFELDLYAADPDLEGKPIAMTWDHLGRLWVCETMDYPNELAAPGKGRDRIRVCEDTNDDGTADRFTVFAEGLSIPSAILYTHGGIVVQDATETVFLKDTDGDGKADERTVLISNWNLQDTHGGVSNFRYGLDNWIWAMQGYNLSEPVVNGEKQSGFRMGFFRFKLDKKDPPSVTDFEFIRSTNNNTWGLGISEEGLIFGSTANGNPSVFMPIPNRYYEKIQGFSPDRLSSIADSNLFSPIVETIRQVDYHGGYTSGAGHALYTARRYPESWWNRTAFVCGPTGHLVGTFVLKPQGAGFKSANMFNLMAADDEWAAPIMAEVGPDGNVWVVDWYNFIVQHNPTPIGFELGKGNAYVSDLRDKKHGRIYRVVYTGEPSSASMAMPDGGLENRTPEQLVELLTHSNMFWRMHAQRLLVARGDRSIAPQLRKAVVDKTTDAIGLNAGAIHAIWTLKGLSADEELRGADLEAVYGALTHPSAGVRRNAVMALPRNQASLAQIFESDFLEDDQPQVQLATMMAVSDTPKPVLALDPIFDSLNADAHDDPWLYDAILAALAPMHREFLARALTRPTGDPSTHLIQAVRQLSEHYARNGVDGDVYQLIKSIEDAQPLLSEALLSGLSQDWPDDVPTAMPADIELRPDSVIERLSTEGKVAYLKIISTLSADDRYRPTIERVAVRIRSDLDNAELSEKERLAAFSALTSILTPEELGEAFDTQLTPQSSPEYIRGLIAHVASVNHVRIAGHVLDNWALLTPAVRPDALEILVRRVPYAQALLDAVAAETIGARDIPLQFRDRIRSLPDESLQKRAEAIFAAVEPTGDSEPGSVIAKFSHIASVSGNPEKGEEVYAENCAACHTFGDIGSDVGPSLDGISLRDKGEILAEILDPNRSVEGNYLQWMATTNDGEVLTGLLASETKTSIELIDSAGERQGFERSDLENLEMYPLSLMPEGFEELGESQLADLLEFLAAPEQYYPLSIAEVATACSTLGMFTNAKSMHETLAFPEWGLVHFGGVPFKIVDPENYTTNNVILFHPSGPQTKGKPNEVRVEYGASASKLHLLSGVSGWGHPLGEVGTVSLIVRLNYADGSNEEHPLKNGVHFSDYMRVIDVPESKLAFNLDGRQVRYLSIQPTKNAPITSIDFIKGDDGTAPIVIAATIER